MLDCCNGFSCILTLYVAYSGRYCDIDVDGCADLSCFEGVDCEDVQAPGVGAMCGPCPDGFDGNGMKCTGITIISVCISSYFDDSYTFF